MIATRTWEPPLSYLSYACFNHFVYLLSLTVGKTQELQIVTLRSVLVHYQDEYAIIFCFNKASFSINNNVVSQSKQLHISWAAIHLCLALPLPYKPLHWFQYLHSSTKHHIYFKFLNTNGCLGMHSKGNLSRGFFFNNFEIKSLASSGIPRGQRMSTREILA